MMKKSALTLLMLDPLVMHPFPVLSHVVPPFVVTAMVTLLPPPHAVVRQAIPHSVALRMARAARHSQEEGCVVVTNQERPRSGLVQTLTALLASSLPMRIRLLPPSRRTTV